MDYKLATMSDLQDVCHLIEDAKDYLDKQEIHQWTKYYPHEDDFKQDIKNKSLYLVKEKEELLAIYTLNEEVDDDYHNYQWTSDNFCVLHRLCVSPNRQGEGQIILDHIFKQAIKMGYDTMRLDVFASHLAAVHVYEKHGFIKHGEGLWYTGKFYLMEKCLK